jgi:hypothetical protein
MRYLTGGHFPEIFPNDVKWQAMLIGSGGIKMLIHKVDKLAGGVTDICAAVCNASRDEEEAGDAAAKEKAHLCVEGWAFGTGIHEANEQALRRRNKPDIILVVVNMKCLDRTWLYD